MSSMTLWPGSADLHRSRLFRFFLASWVFGWSLRKACSDIFSAHSKCARAHHVPQALKHAVEGGIIHHQQRPVTRLGVLTEN